MRRQLCLDILRCSSVVSYRMGLRALSSSTATRSCILEAQSSKRLISKVEMRYFQSFGLPQEKPALKSNKRQSRRRWQSNPELEEKFAVIFKKALHESVDDAVVEFNQLKQTCGCAVPDWMVVKISSVMGFHGDWEGAKQVLNTQYLATGADQRFARNASVEDHQVLSAVERILNGDNPHSYDIAKRFHKALIDLRFCVLKDAVLKSFMHFLIQRNEVARSLEEFSGFVAHRKAKSISGSLFVVMRAAFRTEDAQLISQARELLKNSVKSRLQTTCLLGCVLLAERRPLQFAQFIHDEEYALRDAEINFICEFAVHNREAVILESLMDVPELFHLDDKARNLVYASMASCYGRTKDVEGLQRTVKMVSTEKHIPSFAVSIQKLAHFYSSINILAPDDLVVLLKTLNE